MKVASLVPLALCLVYYTIYTEATVATTIVVGGTTLLALTAAQVGTVQCHKKVLQ